jgi:hypothetical protein
VFVCGKLTSELAIELQSDLLSFNRCLIRHVGKWNSTIREKFEDAWSSGDHDKASQLLQPARPKLSVAIVDYGSSTRQVASRLPLIFDSLRVFKVVHPAFALVEIDESAPAQRFFIGPRLVGQPCQLASD